MSVVLSDHLPLLASAPDGIQKLRDLVLRLAIEGRITDSDTSGWTQTTLGDVGDWGSGGTPLKAHTDYYGGTIPWLVIGDLNDGLVTAAETHITEKGLANSSAKLMPAGTLLIAMYGSIGKLGIAGIECATNQAIAHCKVNSAIAECRFLFYFVRAIRGQLLSSGQGLAQQNISQKLLKATPIQLPPLAEQRRIVTKVDELMVLCDRLEAEQADAASAHALLVETLLGTLAQSTNAADLSANWQRLAEHFDTLFTTEASIDVLKRTILQLAVMGKLVQQEPNDEPANELLKLIAAKRALMEAEGVWKKSKPLPPVGADEQQHSIPPTWEYVRLQEICSTITDGTHQTPKYTESGRPFLSAQNVKPFRFMPEFFRYVSEEDYQGYVKSSKPEFGDILLTRVGAMIGEAAVIDKHMDFAIYVSLALLKPCHPFVLPEFVTLWLNSPFGTHSSIRDTLGRGVSAGNLNLSMIRAFAVPLPPINEQKRIVAKVDQLVLLCDRLKTDFADASRHQGTLADTLIESALEAA